MKKPKLVILRGRPASGKSTAFAALKKRGEFKEWALIDFPELKSWFANIEDSRELKKKALFVVLKEIMKKKNNILLEEMSRDTIMKYIGSYVKKHKYQITVFQFTVETKKAKRRDKTRVADPKHPHCQVVDIGGMHKMHDERFDKKATLVDCDILSKSKVVNLILNELKLIP